MPEIMEPEILEARLLHPTREPMAHLPAVGKNRGLPESAGEPRNRGARGGELLLGWPRTLGRSGFLFCLGPRTARHREAARGPGPEAGASSARRCPGANFEAGRAPEVPAH